MKRSLNQSGIAAVLLVVVVLVVAGVAFLAYAKLSDRTTLLSDSAPTAGVPATIETKQDVTAATKALDATSVDSELNADQLDNDINALY